MVADSLFLRLDGAGLAPIDGQLLAGLNGVLGQLVPKRAASPAIGRLARSPSVSSPARRRPDRASASSSSAETGRTRTSVPPPKRASARAAAAWGASA